MPAHYRVALLITPDSAYTRGLLHGIKTFAREHSRWSICHGEFSREEASVGGVAKWQGDGIIARIENKAVARCVMSSGLPVVDTSAARWWPSCPAVHSDDEEVGRLAAQHLLERGFQNFAFCGDPRRPWSRSRQEFFCRSIAAAGHRCEVYRASGQLAPRSLWRLKTSDLARWVRKLAKPVAVMAAWDGYGQQVLEACQQAGLAVPDAVAVLGVDNDDRVCEMSEPPLSSVILDPRRTGYQAAELLDRMMAGQRVAPEMHRVKPLGIATRQSTDIQAVEDPEIVEAVRYIRRRACEGIRVADVLEHLQISRRILERRFKDLLDRSPHEELVRVRIARVKQFLAETDLVLPAIAQRAGFQHPEYMSVLFRKQTGQTPGQYRRQFR